LQVAKCRVHTRYTAVIYNTTPGHPAGHVASTPAPVLRATPAFRGAALPNWVPESLSQLAAAATDPLKSPQRGSDSLIGSNLTEPYLSDFPKTPLKIPISCSTNASRMERNRA
jgi:hypothetical protein